MATKSYRLNGVQILEYAQAGVRLHTAQDAVDTIGDCSAAAFESVALRDFIYEGERRQLGLVSG